MLPRSLPPPAPASRLDSWGKGYTHQTGLKSPFILHTAGRTCKCQPGPVCRNPTADAEGTHNPELYCLRWTMAELVRSSRGGN